MRRFSARIAGLLAFIAITGTVFVQADLALAAPGDPVATLSVPSTIVEGTGGTTTLVAEVTLDVAAPGALSVTLATSDGSASSAGDSDFQAQSITITFLAGAVGPTTINIPITTDDVDESDETLSLTLTADSAGVEVAGTPATVTILDDDAPLVATLSVLPTVVEGTGGTNLLQAQIFLSRASTVPLNFVLATTDGSASSAGSSDFQAQSVNVTFLAGAAGPATISIPITTDDVDEPDETFSVSLTTSSPGVLVAGVPATVMIQDDDDPLLASLVVSPTVVEGTGGTNLLQAQIVLSRASAVPLTFTLATADGSASSAGGSDFQAQSVNVTFQAGALGPAIINIPITTDSVIEDNETLLTSLTTSSPGVTVTGSPVTTTILDDDDTTKPTVTIDQSLSQVDPTHVTSITFTATFDEPVVGFGSSDVTLAGTAGATTVSVTGGPLLYTVTVTGMTQPGTVIATIAAGVVADSHGNTNTASTSIDNTVTFLGAGPASTTRGALASTGAAPTQGSLFAVALILFGATFLIARRARGQARTA